MCSPPPGGGGADGGEDARAADDAPTPSRVSCTGPSARRIELALRLGGLADQLVQGFAAEKAGRQHRRASVLEG